MKPVKCDFAQVTFIKEFFCHHCYLHHSSKYKMLFKCKIEQLKHSLSVGEKKRKSVQPLRTALGFYTHKHHLHTLTSR